MSEKDGREEADDDDNWVTVGARPRQRAAPPPSAPAPASGSRRKRQEQPASARRPEPRENDWQLVMRSRQALTKLRDEDFALTRLGQIHAGDLADRRRANPRPAARSRLGAKFPTSAAPERPARPPPVLRRPARLVMPKFDASLRSETDFPSLRGKPEPAAPPASTTEKRRSSVALKLDESLRSMAGAGAAAQQGDSAAAAAPMPPPPVVRSPAYAEAVSWRAWPARKSERRDQVRGEIREDVAMLNTAGSVQKTAAESPPATADSSGPTASGDSPQKKKEKEKRLSKKAKKKESQLIQARLNASKDTHVQLVTADAFERLHGAPGSRWRRSQAEAVDLRAADQYPSLGETAAAAAVPPAAASATAAEEPPQPESPQQEPRPPDRREAGGVKLYSRMLRELPKTLPPPTDVKELLEAKEVKEAKRKAPKKRAPIETSILDLAERTRPARARRTAGDQAVIKPPSRRTLQPIRLTGNRLDSTVPVHKRGKERAKKKKPSPLKRVILRERAERRRKMGLEEAAAALMAGLAVAEGVKGEGEGGPAVSEGDGVMTQPAEGGKVTAASVVKQGSTPPKQGFVLLQRRDSGLTGQPADSGAAQQSSPQKPTAILRQEPAFPASSHKASPEKKSIIGPLPMPDFKIEQEPISPMPPQGTNMETKPAAGSTSHSVEMTKVKMKQEPMSSASLKNTETKPATSIVHNSTLKIPVQIKEEPISPISPKQDSTETNPSTGASPASAWNASSKIKQEPAPKPEDEKPSVSPTAAPVSDAKDQKPTNNSDDDDDAPPSRGPDYTPSLTVDPKVLIHSRKFREYCQQTLSPDIDDSARLLLQDLTRFQDRLYNRDPIKARSRRRLVFGLREVSKHLAIRKLACVILAPNIEKIETAGGLDQAVQRLLTLASEREVPLVFALKRRSLGHACKKPVPVSCVGIFNYQGSEDNYKRLMQLTEAAQERYRAVVADVERALQPRQEQPSPAEQLLGAIDGVGRQKQPQVVREGGGEDPTQTLLAKLRSVTLDSPVSL